MQVTRCTNIPTKFHGQSEYTHYGPMVLLSDQIFTLKAWEESGSAWCPDAISFLTPYVGGVLCLLRLQPQRGGEHGLASAGTGLVCPDLVPGPISLSGFTLSSGLVNGYLLYDGALVPAQGLFVSVTGTHCCALPARLGTLFFSFLLLMLTWTPLHSL